MRDLLSYGPFCMVLLPVVRMAVTPPASFRICCNECIRNGSHRAAVRGIWLREATGRNVGVFLLMKNAVGSGRTVVHEISCSYLETNSQLPGSSSFALPLPCLDLYDVLLLVNPGSLPQIDHSRSNGSLVELDLQAGVPQHRKHGRRGFNMCFVSLPMAHQVILIIGDWLFGTPCIVQAGRMLLAITGETKRM